MKEQTMVQHANNIAHLGQFRRDGVTPYVHHPESVALRVRHHGPDFEAVALLHDVLEDNLHWTPTRLLDEGIPPHVVDAVVAITKVPGENYEGYIERVDSNSLARVVKIADIMANLADHPKPKAIHKYAVALAHLTRAPHYEAMLAEED